MALVSFEDFYQVPELNFDILRLRKDLDKILVKKNLIHQELLILVLFQLIKSQMIVVLFREIILEENIGLSQMIQAKKYQEM